MDSATADASSDSDGTTVRPTKPVFLSPVPFYGTVLISIAGCILLLCCIVWCCAFLCRKKKRGGGKRARIANSKSPSALLRSEQVQPDIEDLVDGTQDENENKEEFLGKLNFSIDYNRATSELSVGVLQAQQLPAMDMGGSSDPYVKVRLLPAMKPIFETDVQHKSLYPVFNETFVFQVPYSELASRTVAFYIFDYDRFSKDELIGNVFFRLAEYDAHKVLLEWRDIQKPSLADEITYGDLCLSLRYVPASGHLTVVVLEAKSLPVLETGDNPDTYVKLSLIRNGKRVQKKKTSVKKSTINPYFNESFVFDVPYEHIQNMKLLATVAVPGWLGKSKRIGSIELGSEVEIGSAMRHWSDMLSNPRRPIASWHQLQGLSPS